MSCEGIRILLMRRLFWGVPLLLLAGAVGYTLWLGWMVKDDLTQAESSAAALPIRSGGRRRRGSRPSGGVAADLRGQRGLAHRRHLVASARSPPTGGRRRGRHPRPEPVPRTRSPWMASSPWARPWISSRGSPRVAAWTWPASSSSPRPSPRRTQHSPGPATRSPQRTPPATPASLKTRFDRYVGILADAESALASAQTATSGAAHA